jgi:putative serine protease PepD
LLPAGKASCRLPEAKTGAGFDDTATSWRDRYAQEQKVEQPMDPTARVLNANPPIHNRPVSRLVLPLALGALLVVAGCSAGAGAPSASPTPAASPAASPAIASALQRDFISVVSRISPSVVVIQTATGLGSGVVFDAKGDIVTNNHVVAGSTTFDVTLADGRKLSGSLVGAYPAGDLAVIRVPSTDVQPAEFGDSSKLVVGDIVLAVGNPLGLDTSVTEGIVSALGRTVPESSTITLPDVIQASAEINPGNSGGALVNLAGDVVGIPTLAALDPQLGDVAAPGIGFAISSNVAVDVANQLIATGEVTTPPQPAASAAASPAQGAAAP